MAKLYSNPWKNRNNISSKIKSFARKKFYKWLLRKYCKGCKTVLDVGCGPGQFMKVAESLGFKAKGIDLDERYKAKNVMIKDLWKVKGKYDVVFNSQVMGCVQDHGKFVRKLAELSKNIVITISAYPSISFWNSPDNVQPTTKVRVRWLFRRHGFRNLLSVHVPFYKAVVVVSKRVTSKDKDLESKLIRQGFW